MSCPSSHAEFVSETAIGEATSCRSPNDVEDAWLKNQTPDLALMAVQHHFPDLHAHGRTPHIW